MAPIKVERKLTEVEIVDLSVLDPDVVLLGLELLPETRDFSIGRGQLLALLGCKRRPLLSLLVESRVLEEARQAQNHCLGGIG